MDTAMAERNIGCEKIYGSAIGVPSAYQNDVPIIFISLAHESSKYTAVWRAYQTEPILQMCGVHETLQDVVRELKFGDGSTHAIATHGNGASQGLPGDVSAPALAQCRAMDLSCVRKRPASALGSTCGSWASQHMLSVEGISTLA